MIDSALKYYLQQNGISDTIYRKFHPSDPDTSLCIYTTPGQRSEFKHDYDSTGIQIETRALDPDTAETLAYSAYSILQGIGTQTISGIHFVSIQALQNPFILRRDERDRTIYVSNYIIETYNNTTNRV